MKNSLFQFIDQLKSQVIKPKVYGIVLRVNAMQYLSMQAAFSLEEAFGIAKENFKRDNPTVSMASVVLEMFVQGELIEIFSPFLTAKVQKEESDKNTLMKQIIDGKDLKLFQEHKALFTENEQKYLQAEIRK